MEAALPLTVPLASVGQGAGASPLTAAPVIRQSLSGSFVGVNCKNSGARCPAAAVEIASVPFLCIMIQTNPRAQRIPTHWSSVV